MNTWNNTQILWLVLGACGFLLVISLSPLRAIIGGIWSHLIHPILVGILTTAWLWVIFLAKSTIMAHWDWARNLLLPRKTLLPSLEDDDEWIL